MWNARHAQGFRGMYVELGGALAALSGHPASRARLECRMCRFSALRLGRGVVLRKGFSLKRHLAASFGRTSRRALALTSKNVLAVGVLAIGIYGVV